MTPRELLERWCRLRGLQFVNMTRVVAKDPKRHMRLQTQAATDRSQADRVFAVQVLQLPRPYRERLVLAMSLQGIAVTPDTDWQCLHKGDSAIFDPKQWTQDQFTAWIANASYSTELPECSVCLENVMSVFPCACGQAKVCADCAPTLGCKCPVCKKPWKGKKAEVALWDSQLATLSLAESSPAGETPLGPGSKMPGSQR